MTEHNMQIIQLSEEYNDALLMIWSAQPTDKEVNNVFATMRGKLDNATKIIHCIVDLRYNPSFPMVATLRGALHTQSHINMGRWLVIGGNSTARFIGRTIVSTLRNNVDWVDNEEEAYRLLENLIHQEVGSN